MSVPAMSTAIQRPRISLPGVLVLGAVSVLLFGACLLWPNPRGLWGPLATLVFAWLLFAIHLACCGRSLSSFDPLIWIPVIFLLHYFGMPVAVEVLGAASFDGYDAWGLGGPPRLTHGFAVALLSFASLLFGAQLAGSTPTQRPPSEPDLSESSTLGPAMCLFVGGWLLILIGIPLAGAALLSGEYVELRRAEKFATADLRFFYSGVVFASAGIYGVVANYTRRSATHTLIACASAVVLAGLLTLVGDRAGLSVLAIAGGWVFTQRVRVVRRWPVVIGFVFALLFMPVIKEWRDYRSLEEQRSVGGLFAEAFYEMGSSLQVFLYTLEHIPRDTGYNWGASKISQVINQIPNLGLNPGQHLGFDPLLHNPGAWMLSTINPEKFQNEAGGYGFAMGAEWYFNFGMPGVLLGMTLSGWALGRVRNLARRSPMWLTFSALFIGMYALLVRNALAYPLRTMLWPMIGLLLLQMIWPRRSSVPSYPNRAVGHQVGDTR